MAWLHYLSRVYYESHTNKGESRGSVAAVPMILYDRIFDIWPNLKYTPEKKPYDMACTVP